MATVDEMRDILQQAMDVLEPIAESGNIWAMAWHTRLGIALSIGDDDLIEQTYVALRESISSLLDIVSKLYAALVEYGVIEPTTEGEQDGSAG